MLCAQNLRCKLQMQTSICAGALSSADAPGVGAAAGQLPAAAGGQGPEPVKWWQSGQAAFGAAALPAGISSANAFYSSQDAHAAEQPAAPQPKSVCTRSALAFIHLMTDDAAPDPLT